MALQFTISLYGKNYPYNKTRPCSKMNLWTLAILTGVSSNEIIVTTQQFILLNVAFLIFFVLVFLWGRRGSKAPSTLRMGPPDSGSLERQAGTDKSPAISSLFIYNGHTWDAYEVLGIPPGSSVDTIRSLFEQALNKNQVSSHDFLKAALSSILTDLKARGYKPN